MNEEGLWKQFATTGSVQDYLVYREENRMKMTNTTGRRNEGSSSNERDSNTYRDDTHGISHERVR